MDSHSPVPQAQLAAILGADPAPFEALISHLMSSSNEHRSQAELIFNLCKQLDPNALVLKLAQLLQLSPHTEARGMSAVLLRKQLTQDDSLVWNLLSPATRCSVKSILLTCVQNEEVKSIMKKLCDTISELASTILPENGWPELLPFMFQCVSSESSPKLQESAFLIFAQLSQYVGEAAVYGLGVCAEHGGSVIKPLIGEALSKLSFVIRHPNALQPDNVMAYDNAVSALGKVCHFHRDSIDSAQVIPAWLSCLPIKDDLIEAKSVHDLLCSMIERLSATELLGPNNQHLPKIISIFAEILCAGKELASDETLNRIINLLRQLQQTLPPATLASTWSTLQPQQQLALQSILSS
ncbi:hypothetical protein SSX86_023382 [Deinandra increscens subsp. villosa]|uniref:IPO4/5-like TPR repeats domain-containing protein n=1 Tax=Deinandra increscens subsp. villosa TaxID=3103831 RepID=A0AAP0CKS8_9ASTR